jgi:hypothetical protein
MKELDKIVIGALKEYTSRASIKDTFKRYDITDIQKRVDKLNQYMGNPRTFFQRAEFHWKKPMSLRFKCFSLCPGNLTKFTTGWAWRLRMSEFSVTDEKSAVER